MNVIRFKGVYKSTIYEVARVYKVSLLTAVNNVQGSRNYNEKLPTDGSMFEVESPLLSRPLLLDFCGEVELAIVQLKKKFKQSGNQ